MSKPDTGPMVGGEQGSCPLTSTQTLARVHPSLELPYMRTVIIGNKI